MKHTHYHLKPQEIPIVAGFLLSNIHRDRTEFEAYSDKYNENFLNDFADRIKHEEDLINSDELQSEISNLNKRLYDNVRKLPEQIKKLEQAVASLDNKKDGLVSEINFEQIYRKINALDIDNLIPEVERSIKTLGKKHDALAEKGYKSADFGALEAIIRLIDEDSKKLKEKYKKRENLIENHQEDIDKLWQEMEQLMELGHNLLKNVSQKKANDYLLSHLKMRLKEDTK
jgi:Ca2+-binding EF-hand superfamily protein